MFDQTELFPVCGSEYCNMSVFLGAGYGQAAPPQTGYGKQPGQPGYDGAGGYGMQGEYGADRGGSGGYGQQGAGPGGAGMT